MEMSARICYYNTVTYTCVSYTVRLCARVHYYSVLGKSFYSYLAGAWWYKACLNVCLNGQYSANGVSHANAAGVNWCCTWKGHMDSLVSTTMRITRN